MLFSCNPVFLCADGKGVRQRAELSSHSIPYLFCKMLYNHVSLLKFVYFVMHKFFLKCLEKKASWSI